MTSNVEQLLLPLSYNSTQMTICILTREYRNPQHKETKPGSEYLEPRSSFQRWVETIAGTSKEWTEDQSMSHPRQHTRRLMRLAVDTASVLALLYGRFIETWRLKGSGEQADSVAAPASDAAFPVAQISEEAFNLNQTGRSTNSRA